MADLAQALISEEEGCKLQAFRDTKGLWTIGYGHLLPDQNHDYSNFVWTQAQADAQLAKDLSVARMIAPRFPWFTSMNDVRQAVCVSMAFQLGDKPLHWPNFDAALSARNYVAAAGAGRDTDWWREQTPKRAEREMSMLATGAWWPHT